MTKKVEMTFEGDMAFLSGDLNFTNVMSVYAASLCAFATRPNGCVDFSRLSSSDSAGLALIIEWMKLARERHQVVTCQHLSQDLVSIAKAAGIYALIFSTDTDKRTE